MTDAQRARIEPLLLPDRTPRRGGRWRDHRQVIDAIAFKIAPGRRGWSCPGIFGSGKGAHNRLRMWGRPTAPGRRRSPRCSRRPTPQAIWTGPSRSKPAHVAADPVREGACGRRLRRWFSIRRTELVSACRVPSVMSSTWVRSRTCRTVSRSWSRVSSGVPSPWTLAEETSTVRRIPSRWWRYRPARFGCRRC
ncbi:MULTISPECIES: transposase [Streptomyces]|uniref:transposase n=1 Tax=Streptomyces TaxID=1883 RepID=UPI0009A0FE0D